MTTPATIAMPLVKASEGCCLRAYPDPASELYKAMSKRRIIRAYMAGQGEVPDDLRHLSGAPWTVGYGQTGKHVMENLRWTQAQADLALTLELEHFLLGVYKRCPDLYLHPHEMAAACLSLAYNIGLGAFGASSVCRHIKRDELYKAADAFRMWRFAKGKEMAGLKVRREAERALFLKGVD